MRAHGERPETEARSQQPGARRTPSLPGGYGRGPISPEKLADLQGLVGNQVVARLAEEIRHVHGAGCGHADTGGEAGVQRALLDAAMTSSPGRPLPNHLRREAEAFYQNDLSPTRIHDDPVAREATAALGAQAMTVGSHIFLPPEAASDKSVVGHELSHVNSNLAGVPETGDTNSAGVTVTNPRQDSEKRAHTDGVAFAAGAGRAPSAGIQPTRTGGGNGEPVVARMESTAGTKEKGSAGGQFPGRDEMIAEVDRLAKACTCKQNKKQWGRITKEVVIRYARDYKDDREGQSLRHLSRQMLNALAAEERKERESAPAPASTAAEAGKKGPKPVREQEIQATNVNGHLVFASNYNQSMFRLYDLLKELSGDTDEEDLGGGDSLQQLMGKDFGVRDYDSDAEESGGSDTESDSEAEAAPPTAKARGKRPATAKRTGKKEKRRKTEPEEGGETAGAKVRKGEERKRRDRQALLKIREGFTPRTQRLESVDPDAMDLDEPEGGAGGFKRDNATLKALRAASHIRLVDISNDKSQDPAYRQYLASLLAKDGDYPGYVYLVHNGVGAGKMHAEQKLLQMLQNAEFTGKTPHDPIHIRGTKRPCDACLAMLRYFQERVELDLVFNLRGNHYFTEALKTGGKNLTGHDQARAEDFAGHMREYMGDEERVMYETAAKHVAPAPEGNGLGPAVVGADGGMEQRYEVPVKGTDKSGEIVREFLPGNDIHAMVDTPSNSEAEDDGGMMTDLMSRTRHLRIGNKPGAQAPDTRESKALLEAREQAEFVATVEPQLKAAAGELFWAEVNARTAQGGKFTLAFPGDLRRKIQELCEENSRLKVRIAKRFKISTISLDKQLGKLADDSRKLRYRLGQIEGASARLEAAMPPEMRRLWDAQRQENTRTGKKKNLNSAQVEFTPQFERLLYDMIYTEDQTISMNSIADHLLMPQSTFKNRAENIERKYAS